jgi:hypothetical protein
LGRFGGTGTLLGVWGAVCVALSALAFVPSPPLWGSFGGAPQVERRAPNLPPVKARLRVPADPSPIVDRPIFNFARAPDPKPAAAPDAVTAAPAALGDLSKIRLTGVVSHRDDGVAFLTRGDGQQTVLALGDSLEGWTIKSIDATGVRLEGQGQSSWLRLPAAENRAQNSPQTNPGQP